MQTLSLLTLSLSLQRPPLLERRVAPPLSLGAAAFGRRHLLSAVPAAAAALSLSQLSAPATAAAGVPTQQELGRLAQGYSRLQYLLQNWEKLTTVCIKGCVGAPEQCGCIRDPVIVQSYMGFKSMEDPLFKADQLMIRAQQLVASDKDLDAYTDAVDRWTRKCDAANVMAYTSSWGEANPGGGKSEVERYLAKSRKEVVESAEILKTIMDLLDIPEASADSFASGVKRVEANQRR